MSAEGACANCMEDSDDLTPTTSGREKMNRNGCGRRSARGTQGNRPGGALTRKERRSDDVQIQKTWMVPPLFRWV